MMSNDAKNFDILAIKHLT